jgi:hypothetical protein
MKHLAVLTIICMTIPPMANAKSCHSNSAQGRGNLNCAAQHSQSSQNSQTPTSGLGPSGQTPDPSSINQHLGMGILTPAQPIAVVKPMVAPPKPATALTATQNLAPNPVATSTPKTNPQVAQQTPQPMKDPMATPQPIPQVAQQTPQPMKAPMATPQPIPQVAQQTPQPMKAPMATPQPIPQVAQQTPQPMKAPMATPQPIPQVAQQTPQPMKAPMATPQPIPQVAQQTPQPIKAPMATPQPIPQVTQQTPQPMKAPMATTQPIPQVAQQTPQPMKAPMATPQPIPQLAKQTPQPMAVLVPHHTKGTINPRPQVVQMPEKSSPTVTGTQSSKGATHHILTGNPSEGLGALRISGAILTSEIVEPGIQNQRVELYRSNDAKEVLYQDVIPMDKTGFHLTIIGTRPPTYQ